MTHEERARRDLLTTDGQGIAHKERALRLLLDAERNEALERAANECMALAERYAGAAREHGRTQEVAHVGPSPEWDAQRGARMAAHKIRALIGGGDGP